ncbi:MAG: formylmethanofuran dehydrogenase subunit E family protein [Bacteroidetes bacterium]|nr:formylmethanofuran dehydrogenase subunit E family protein [Bacteroidota bacterium]
MRYSLIGIVFFLSACSANKHISFTTIDTDFSKGRLTNQQTISLKDIEKFHGHLCDGLVVGVLAMQQALNELYPNQPIDRTNLRIVSMPSPCLTDVAIYLTGGRYQFNTFYVDTAFSGVYIIQRIDNNQTVSVSLNKGIKPSAIDSLGSLAKQQILSPCEIDNLKNLEYNFTKKLFHSDPTKIFTVKKIDYFNWQPNTKNNYLKTDILNKVLPKCNNIQH